MTAEVHPRGGQVTLFAVRGDIAFCAYLDGPHPSTAQPRIADLRLDLLTPVETDGATLGALRQVIRELRGDPSWSPTPLAHDPGVVEWVIDPPSRERQTLYHSEFAAMMAAYERITWPTS
jgi:hypothetical protein